MKKLTSSWLITRLVFFIAVMLISIPIALSLFSMGAGMMNVSSSAANLIGVIIMAADVIAVIILWVFCIMRLKASVDVYNGN